MKVKGWTVIRTVLLVIAFLAALLWTNFVTGFSNAAALPLFFTFVAALAWVDIWQYDSEKRTQRTWAALVATAVAFALVFYYHTYPLH